MAIDHAGEPKQQYCFRSDLMAQIARNGFPMPKKAIPKSPFLEELKANSQIQPFHHFAGLTSVVGAARSHH